MKRAGNELDRMLKKAAERKEKIAAAEQALASSVAREEQELEATHPAGPPASDPVVNTESPVPVAAGSEPTSTASIFTLPAKPCTIVSLVADADSECATRP